MADDDPSRTHNGPFRTTELIRQRVVEAVLGQSALNHTGLADNIRRRFGATDVRAGALVREPVIEGAAGFQLADRSFAALSGTLLHPKVVEAISGGHEDREHRFPPNAKPYLHQIQSWEILKQPEPQSVLVSSGTGSGKTECFLLPLLDDLVREAEREGRLSGVRALALYPLNALIASQQERLSAWTKPFGGQIRFGLYNGMTQNSVRANEQAEYPEQVLGRDTLRKDPPPILVTNVTMLEYMTIRKIDRPLLENSQGKLRWIILDEAHGYVGSAAAEIALLIRRVLLAFGVRAEDVRFVATSATIGGGQDVTDELRRFLHDISGVDENRVHIVQGHRQDVLLPSPGKVVTLSPQDLMNKQVLAQNPAVQSFVIAAQKQSIGLKDARAMLMPTKCNPETVIEAIAEDRISEPILQLRVHNFLRAVPGLWSCINPNCSGDRPQDWMFGALIPEKVERCPDCKSPVLEIVSCSECGEPYLDAIEEGDHLRQSALDLSEDEFAAASEREAPEEESEEEEDQSAKAVRSSTHWSRLLASRLLKGMKALSVDPATGAIYDRPRDNARTFFLTEFGKEDICCNCEAQPSARRPKVFRPIRFGAPFLIGNATPVLIEGVPPNLASDTVHIRPPADGRQLLSFTDSRQGTARFAASIQTNAERGYVRAFIYHLVQATLRSEPSDHEAVQRRAELDALEAAANANPILADVVKRERKKFADLLDPKGEGQSWQNVCDRLASEPEVSDWMRQVWGSRDERYKNDKESFANFLLLRELDRRPRRGNALETMGLARLSFAAIDNLTAEKVPSEFRERGASLEDWQGFLHTILDLFVRNNFATLINPSDAHWLIKKGGRKVVLPPDEGAKSQYERAWPKARSAHTAPSQFVCILRDGLALNLENGQDRADINSILALAWSAIKPVLVGGPSGYMLDFKKAHVFPVTKGWLCPVTRRVLYNVPFNMTPYGHREGSPFMRVKPWELNFPRLPITFPKNTAAKEQIAYWLRSDPAVTELRSMGVWNNLHDRIASMSPYLRAAEHSAQQPPERLRTFEAAFKRGEINILNCSTTMEMGVDIGSVSSVMMTNVPPSITNYRQRVGRAGRRKQGFASSLTFTRDTPLDRETFRDPISYLNRKIRAPQVKLDSQRIVQRHLNAFLLSQWFAQAGGQLNQMTTGEFFGCPSAVDDKRSDFLPCCECINWMVAPGTKQSMTSAIQALVKGTILQSDNGLHEAAAEAVQRATDIFVAEWTALQAQAREMQQEAAKKSFAFQIQRLCKESLLKDLANRAVLPGHGFPTNVVMFVNKDKPDSDEGSADNEGARGSRRSYPSRNLDIAIRDYAPGAEVVVDGLVYHSAGVTLNWKKPADLDDVREIQSIRSYWECAECGAADCTRIPPDACPSCQAPLDLFRRFLEPAGFTVDVNQKPHADTDEVLYIEPEPEHVAARDAAWEPFLDPSLGRMRKSSNGLVFYASGGAFNKGYRICLECGRAEADHGDGSNPLAGHAPLRFTKKMIDGSCPGNGHSFSITDPIALGHEVATDISEFQPALITGEGAAWAMVSALREALARMLGIEAREMGMAVARRRGFLGEQTWSLFLFDRNSGGAGFAPKAVDFFTDLLKDARDILDCSMPGCEKGCSACVLTSDLHGQQELIDRQAALADVCRLLAQTAEPATEDQAMDGAQLSRQVADSISNELVTSPGELKIFIRQAFDLSALYQEPFAGLFAIAAQRGATVSLAIASSILLQMDAAQRLGLRDAATRWSLRLFEGDTAPAANNADIVATFSHKGMTKAWLSRDAAVAAIGPDWGIGRNAPVVVGNWRHEISLLPLLDDVLLPSPDVTFEEVSNQLDCPIDFFGDRFAKLVKKNLQKLNTWKPGDLKAIRYSDRYLRSPLSIRLALSAFSALRDALAGKGAAIPLTIDSVLLRPDYGRHPYLIGHDWQNEDVRKDVVVGLAKKMGFDVEFNVGGAMHARELTLEYAALQVRLRLDQGFGHWRATRSAKFEFGTSPAHQVRALLDSRLFVSGVGRTHIVFLR